MALDDVLNTSTLKDTTTIATIAYIPDLHVATDALREVSFNILERAQGRDAYIAISDIDEKKDRSRLARELGLPTKEGVILNIIGSELKTDEERDVFGYLFAIESQGGIDNYLNLVQAQNPTVDIDGEKKRYVDLVSKSKTSGLEEKLVGIAKNKQEEINKGITQSMLLNVAFDRAVSRYNLQKVVDEVKRINLDAEEQGLGKIKLIAGAGNHDTEYDIAYLQSQLGEDIVYNAHKIQGAIELGEGEEKIRFQLSGNCYGISHQFEEQAYLPEYLEILYPHMTLEKALVQDFDPTRLDEISELDALQSTEYQRIMRGEQGENLDFLLLHNEVGEPMGYEGRSLYPNLDSVGVLYTIANNLKRDENGLARVYSGHLHGEANKTVNDWRIKKFRNYASIIDKNGEEILEIGSKHPKLDYEMDAIKVLFEQEYQTLSGQLQSANDDDYNQNELPRVA